MTASSGNAKHWNQRRRTKIAQYFKTSGDYVREAYSGGEANERIRPHLKWLRTEKNKALDQENAFQVGDQAPKPRQIAFEESIEL
jgi:hypothetical protein